MHKISSLNDIEKKCFASGDTEIWYMKPDFFSQGIIGLLPDPNDLSKTHVLLGKVEERRLEAIFWMMQGEYWSPKGEGKHLIAEKGINHTSMCVGDVVKIGDSVFVAETMGWKKVAGQEEQTDGIE